MKKGKVIISALTIIFILVTIIYGVKILADTGVPTSDETAPVNVPVEKDPLVEYGFSEEETSLIKEKNSEDAIELIMEKNYDKEIFLGLVKEKYYVDDNLERYFNYVSSSGKSDPKEVVKDVNSYIDFEFYTDTMDSDTSKGILTIVNKHYHLESEYEGIDLVDLPTFYEHYGRSFKVNRETLEHFEEMWKAAKEEGLDFRIYSAYRSYDTQVRLYNNYKAQDGQEEADTYSARAGYSEHQTGLALDFKSRTMNTDYFQRTKEFEWLQENAHKYGFILRYNLGQEYITGYQYEPWHYRYCGVECATYIYENNINFEEYYEYYVKES